MKHYYFADNDQQFGPFTFDELKTKRLKKSTLVWTEGMQDWTIANDIDELKDILISEPPPLPKKKTGPTTFEAIQYKQTPPPVTITKYDLAYEKETEATFVGIMLLVIPLILKFSGAITFETEESYKEARTVFAVGSLILRIGVTVWVGNIASRQNRNSTGWVWFAFFLPSIALIVIGQLKKLRIKIELDGSLPAKQQASILFEKANEIFSDKRFSECIEILNKAVEIDSQNFECIKLRGIANYNTENYQEARFDFESLIQNQMFPEIANYYLGNLAIMDRDRELAVEYWIKAEENKNEDAKIKLDNYHTYTGNYLLDNSQAKRKINIDSSGQWIHFGDGKYQGGLPQIDLIEEPGLFNTQINCYALGLDIELKRKFKTFHLAISYYEIDNIVYKEVDKLFELHLIDKNILTFSYDQTKDYNEGLKNLCNRFKLATGKTSDASSAWKY
jgi:tetratricopeptide (TPR) repeat protein